MWAFSDDQAPFCLQEGPLPQLTSMLGGESFLPGPRLST